MESRQVIRSVSADFCACAGPARVATRRSPPNHARLYIPAPTIRSNDPGTVRADDAPQQELVASFRLAHRGIKRAAVQQQILPDDVPRGGGAEEGAGLAELRRITDAPGRRVGRA